MIFTETIEQVLAGTKTQTRRTVRPGDTPYTPLYSRFSEPLNEHMNIWYVCNGTRECYARGKVLAVQAGRGMPSIAHIVIDAIRYVPCVWTISDTDARAEGFETPADFRKAFAKANRLRVESMHRLDMPAWALTFHLVTVP